MKTLFKTLFILTAFSISSCKSNDDSQEIALANDLGIIAQKLELLETDIILDSSDNLNKKYNPNKLKKSRKALETCTHEVTEESTNANQTVKMSVKIFDKDGNAITDCELDNILNNFPINYAIEEKFFISTPDAELDLTMYSKFSASLKQNSFTSVFSESRNTDVIFYMRFEKTSFDFLPGSYINVDRSITMNQNMSDNEIEQLFEETDYNLNLKYIIGLDANENDYHFDLVINNEDFNQKRIEKDYNLLNAKNKKVGTIKYTLFASGSESFLVYDLDNNLVE